MGDLGGVFSISSPALSAAALLPLAFEARQLEPPLPSERTSVLRDDAALQIDALLARVARGSGALDVSLGEALAALAEGDRVLRLGYSSIGDYARERLGIAGRTALAMARLARELRSRPIMREAVRRGEVSPRKAQTVLRVAQGEAEEHWLARARLETVRALEAAVRAAETAGGESEDDEKLERLYFPLAPERQVRLNEAMELAGKILGATAPKWQRLEAICEEFIGAHPVEEPSHDETGEGLAEPGAPGAGRTETRLPSESFEQLLESETAYWAVLKAVEPVESPVRTEESDLDPFQLDEVLRRLVSMRERWDELVGHLAMLMRMLGLWRELGFASFSHYCAERLDSCPRAGTGWVDLGARRSVEKAAAGGGEGNA